MWGGVRAEDQGRLCNPARLTQTPRSALRNSHFPDSPTPTPEHSIPRPLDKEGRHESSPRGQQPVADSRALDDLGCARLRHGEVTVATVSPGAVEIPRLTAR